MIALDDLRVTAAYDLADMVNRSRIARAPQHPAILAGASGVLDLTFLTRRADRLPPHLSDMKRPHLLIVGDDPGTGQGTAGGPNVWRCAPYLRDFRPASCFVHASGGHQADYAAMVQATQEVGRLLMIETSSARGREWGEFVRSHCPTVTWLPQDGEHPIADTLH